jgi:hypothetical protein
MQQKRGKRLFQAVNNLNKRLNGYKYFEQQWGKLLYWHKIRVQSR